MTIYFLVALILISSALYFYLFYPKQTMPAGIQIPIKTHEPKKYKDDCLHPCVRYIPDGFMGYNWWMVQSPYYGRNSELENPVLYYARETDHPLKWELAGLVRDTPETGFNSDPVLFYENRILWIFWREKLSPLCKSMGITSATVGVKTSDGINFSKPVAFLIQKDSDEDATLCPVLIKKDHHYYFYSSHYQFSPERKSKGIAIWKGTSLDYPDFRLICTIKQNPVFTVDKWKQLSLFKRYIFLPKPLRHNIWHFDLFEYKGKLYMFSVAEWGDNIMLSVSDDFQHFKTFRIPLVNIHYLEQQTGYRSYLYKPSGYISGDILYLYYTSTGREDKLKNELFFSKYKLPFITAN